MICTCTRSVYDEEMVMTCPPTCPMCNGVVDAPAKVERRPVAGWVYIGIGRWTLRIKDGNVLAAVTDDGEIGFRWECNAAIWPSQGTRWQHAHSLAAAQLAAEDALLAVAREIVAPLGKQVMP